MKDVRKLDEALSEERSTEIKSSDPKGEAQWSDYSLLGQGSGLGGDLMSAGTSRRSHKVKNEDIGQSKDLTGKKKS